MTEVFLCMLFFRSVFRIFYHQLLAIHSSNTNYLIHIIDTTYFVFSLEISLTMACGDNKVSCIICVKCIVFCDGYSMRIIKRRLHYLQAHHQKCSQICISAPNELILIKFLLIIVQVTILMAIWS